MNNKDKSKKPILRTIRGYNGEYQISDKGEIFRVGRMNKGLVEVKAQPTQTGLKTITLWKNNERKIIMLHNLYAQTFGVSVEDAKKIIYDGFENSLEAKNNVRFWLMTKINECKDDEKQGINRNDEILYLKSFLEQIK